MLGKEKYQRVKEIVEKENREVSMSDKITKMNEELGEFSAVHLESIGYKYVKNKRSKEEIREHLLEEICDVQIMVMDIMNYYNFTSEEINEMVDKKLDKWENISNI